MTVSLSRTMSDVLGQQKASSENKYGPANTSPAYTKLRAESTSGRHLMTGSRVIVPTLRCSIDHHSLLAAAIALAHRKSQQLGPYRPVSIINGIMTFTALVLVLIVL